jgi:hypothetical protein
MNVSSNGEIFSRKERRSNISSIVNAMDRVYSLDWNSSASKNECTAAIGFKWMLNQVMTKTCSIDNLIGYHFVHLFFHSVPVHSQLGARCARSSFKPSFFSLDLSPLAALLRIYMASIFLFGTSSNSSFLMNVHGGQID